MWNDLGSLAGSPHHVDVLRTLREQPRDWDDLQATLDAPPSAVTSALNAFEARGWVARNGPRHELTTLGWFVADAITNLSETLAIEQWVRPVAEWLPTDVEGFCSTCWPAQ